MNETVKTPQVLTDPTKIEMVKRLLKRVEFSIYFRKVNVQNYAKELKNMEKLKRFLENESHKNVLAESPTWQTILNQLNQSYTQYQNEITKANDVTVDEELLIEQLKSHVYTDEFGNETYDEEFFTTILPYAIVYGDTQDYTPSLRVLMETHGFLEKPKYEQEKEQRESEESKKSD